MKTKVLGLLAGAAVIATMTPACDQPVTTCRTAGGPFAMTFTLVTGTGECAELVGDVVYMQGYNPAGSDGKPDHAIKTMAAQSEAQTFEFFAAADAEGFIPEQGPFTDQDPTHTLIAEGTFVDPNPDANNLCTVATLTPARQNLALIPAYQIPPPEDAPDDPPTDVPETPASDTTYQWRNMQFLVTAELPANAVTADLEYTRNGCTATYKTRGLFPAVYCEGADAEGNPTGMPDSAICNDKGDPNADPPRLVGSGINPTLIDQGVVVCDPNILYCVLNAFPKDESGE